MQISFPINSNDEAQEIYVVNDVEFYHSRMVIDFIIANKNTKKKRKKYIDLMKRFNQNLTQQSLSS